MPRTSFTCRDKILGGYYADPETNCQMFHICVKIAGVGIQDFRFLCPNNTAFDEGAQICTHWGDVDCGAATRFYGSDNFDLYRIGTQFESKRNNYAEEDEVFHLQRAETSDARRSKQYIVNQNSIQSHERPVTTTTTTYRPPTTTSTTQRTTTSTTARAFFEPTTTHVQISTYKPTLQPRKLIDDKPAVSTYRPNNDYFNRAKASPIQDDGEIFKHAQSSHFYNNKNNGKEDFEDEYVKSNTKAPVAKQKVRGRHRGRSKYRNPNAVTSAPTKPPTTFKPEQNTRASFTNTPIVVQPIVTNQRANVTILQAQQQSRVTAAPILSKTTDETFFDVPKVNKKVQSTKLKSAPVNVVPLTSSPAPAPQLPPQIPFNPFFGAIPQRVIIPSQLSPEQRLALQASNGKSLTTASTVAQTTSTTTPVTPQQIQQLNRVDQKPQKFNFKTQKYEFEPQNPTTQFYNTKYETNGQLNLEPTKSNFVRQNKTYANRQTTVGGQEESRPTTFNPQQYYQTNDYQNLSPRGFSLAAQQQAIKQQTKAPEIRPQITSRSESRHHKKFSTLVPKDQYNLPTTFKPSTYSKKQELKLEKIQNPNKFYSQLITTSHAPIVQQSTTQQIPTTTRHPSHFSTSSTPRPLSEGEEDDGQYRPELYEKDLYKNKIKTTKTSTVSTYRPVQNALFSFYQTSSTALPAFNSNNNYEEDELFKTAHSQNIFASGNALRAEKEKEKVVQKTFEQFSEKSSPRPFSKPTPPPSTTSAPKKSSSSVKPAKTVKPKEEKDVSYDYQYYDTNNDQDYPEIEKIEDFGRTVKKSSTNKN